MTTNAVASFGFKMGYNDDGDQAEFPPLAELTLPELSVDEVDVTNHQSEGQTFIPVGPPKAGELQGRIFWREEDEVVLRGIQGKKMAWTVTAPTGSKWEFQGFLRSYTSNASGVDTAEERTFVIRVDGNSTFTPADD